MSAPEFLFNYSNNGIVVQVTTDANYQTGRFKVRYFPVGTLGPATAILRQQRFNVYQFETLDDLIPNVDYAFELLVFGPGGTIIKSPQLIVRSNPPIGLAQSVGVMDFINSSDSTLTFQVARFGNVTPFCMWKKRNDPSYTQTLMPVVSQSICRLTLENLEPNEQYLVFAKMVGANGTRIGPVIPFPTQSFGCPTGALALQPFGVTPNFTTNRDTTLLLEIDINGVSDNGFPITDAEISFFLPQQPRIPVPMSLNGTLAIAQVIGLAPRTDYLGYIEIINSRGFFRSPRAILPTPVYDNDMANLWGGFSNFPTYNETLDELFFLVDQNIPWNWQFDWCDQPDFRLPKALEFQVINGTIFAINISTQTGVGRRYFRATASYDDINGFINMHCSSIADVQVVVSKKTPLLLTGI